MEERISQIDFLVRDETATDNPSVFEVNSEAFEGTQEANLVDRLRIVASPIISLVAEAENGVIGHIFFSPVTVENAAVGSLCMGLGPMAVIPEFQNCGIGSELVERGLDRCRTLGASAVFVLGHPDYYPRFGFRLAAPLGFRYKSERFDPFFFLMELKTGFRDHASGLVRYHPVFDSL